MIHVLVIHRLHLPLIIICLIFLILFCYFFSLRKSTILIPVPKRLPLLPPPPWHTITPFSPYIIARTEEEYNI